MRTIDFSPLFRHSVGFDRMQRMLDAATRMDSSANAYPPYNIEQVGEDNYRISMAVAGFGEQDLDVTVKENTLVVSGKMADEDEDATYLHRGIAGRAFERRFELDDHIKVVGGSLVNGLLNIDLRREVPEEKKPRKIAIETKSAKRIEKKAA
ncbi:MAG: heat-shock protein [Rhodospirillaceae bacterium]|jgi:molecular chaperone IbpA|nr:heat-shock protein [Rhodospirillaceae bacterium]